VPFNTSSNVNAKNNATIHVDKTTLCSAFCSLQSVGVFLRGERRGLSHL
jgi:hypothetical protein